MMYSNQQIAKNHHTHLTLPTVSEPAASEDTMSTGQKKLHRQHGRAASITPAPSRKAVGCSQLQQSQATLTVSKDQGHDVPAIDARNHAKADQDERGGDDPVHVVGNEQLPAVRSNNPAATRRHGEVGDGRDACDKGCREQHLASSLALSSVDAEEQGDAGEHDEGELKEGLSEGGRHVHRLAPVHVDLRALAHEHRHELVRRHPERMLRRGSWERKKQRGSWYPTPDSVLKTPVQMPVCHMHFCIDSNTVKYMVL
eukprot:3735274-Rhodomonas_salina.3